MSHLSFSALKDWYFCPYFYKRTRIEKILPPFVGNEHSAFGNSIHKILEYKIQNKVPENFISWDDFFDKCFIKYIKECYEKGAPKFDKDLVQEIRQQAKEFHPLILPELNKQFPNYKVLGVEEELYEDIKEKSKYKFKGFIDLIILNEQDEKIKVIDYKTTGNIFYYKKNLRENNFLNYQLVLYKHFILKQLKMEDKIKDVETYFALLDRNKKKVEFLRVTSGKKRIENALEVLKSAVSSCESEYYPKKKTSCPKCKLYKTKWCK